MTATSGWRVGGAGCGSLPPVAPADPHPAPRTFSTAPRIPSSLSQTIAGLKKESINSAGKRLVATLGDRKYAGKSPKRFFRDCYDARSNLVHGNLGRPSVETIQGLLGPLEHFVRDLVLERNGLS